MDNDKYIVNTRSVFENYNKDEIGSLLWEMYKGWFLHSAPDLDSDKLIDMLLFYDEIRNLFNEVSIVDTQPL